MLQMYKVFINDKVVLFLSDTLGKNQKYSHLEQIEISKFSPEKLFSYVVSSNAMSFRMVVKNNLEEAFSKWAREFICIDAAGGLVIHPSGDFLGIKRLGKWDLPKGKVEEGEELPAAALREVEEECGISGLVIKDFLLETYHIYPYKDRLALKCTRWYKMNWNGEGELNPQIEEGIEAVRWLGMDQKEMFLQNTYASIKEVLTFLE
jgi:8-oxo-dGTP pyrophosphatase MutT (NUDIX family)